MNNRPKTNVIHSLNQRFFASRRSGRRGIGFSIDKRQKIVISIIFLSLALFITEFQFTRAGIAIAVALSLFTNVFLWWVTYQDVRENKTYQIFILPFFYSLAFGLFYFLTPTIFLSRLLLAMVYAFGLYSLFLSQNILAVSSIRTIALLSGARIVSFVITLVSFFLLTNILFTFHVTIFPIILILLIMGYLLIYHSVWAYTLQQSTQILSIWVSALTVCIVESAAILWFWPSSPTIIALFLTGFLYVIVGLSHIWFEKRLFKGILWEYVWVACAVFFALLVFTSWGK